MSKQSIYSADFGTYEEAAAYQKKTLEKLLAEGEVIRFCDIVWEKDYQTHKQIFRVFIRIFIIDSAATVRATF